MLDVVDIHSAFVALKQEVIQERLETLRKKRFGECLPLAARDRKERLAELPRVAARYNVEEIA